MLELVSDIIGSMKFQTLWLGSPKKKRHGRLARAQSVDRRKKHASQAFTPRIALVLGQFLGLEMSGVSGAGVS